jgi:transposase
MTPHPGHALALVRLDTKRDIIEHLYLVRKMSPRAIAEQVGVSHKTLYNWMVDRGIARRSLQEAQKVRSQRDPRIPVAARMRLEEKLSLKEIGSRLVPPTSRSNVHRILSKCGLTGSSETLPSYEQWEQEWEREQQSDPESGSESAGQEPPEETPAHHPPEPEPREPEPREPEPQEPEPQVKAEKGRKTGQKNLGGQSKTGRVKTGRDKTGKAGREKPSTA